MNILFASAEVAPFAKTGGLGDVSAALPRHLHARGHDVRVFVPFYTRVAAEGRHFEAVENIRDVDVRLGRHQYRFSLLRSTLPGSSLPVYFVHCPILYHRPGLYTQDSDEHLRFLLLQRAALESAQRMGFAPDIIHSNDWQTALMPLMLRTQYAWDRRLFGRTRTVLTIHNLQYQGTFRADILQDTGMAESAHLFHQDQLHEGRLGFMVSGILYADLITTVSPTYAREIQGPELGAGLDGLLRARGHAVLGILNGVDENEWSPERDTHIPHRFSADNLGPKEQNKQALLRALGLPYVPGVPVTGIVSRLASQKGFDLLFDSAPAILAQEDVQLVVLGSGEGRLEDFFRHLQRNFPRKVCFWSGYNNDLAHLIEAGADAFLMPSRYEPCGLNQMYSLRYGTVPIVRKTGGLADTVDSSTGFLFERYAPDALYSAWRLALQTYRDPAAWRRIQLAGMARSFSWETQVQKYEEVYRRLVE